MKVQDDGTIPSDTAFSWEYRPVKQEVWEDAEWLLAEPVHARTERGDLVTIPNGTVIKLRRRVSI